MYLDPIYWKKTNFQGSSYLRRVGRSHFSLQQLGKSEILAGRSEILNVVEMLNVSWLAASTLIVFIFSSSCFDFDLCT